jgi:hypothetical protein
MDELSTLEDPRDKENFAMTKFLSLVQGLFNLLRRGR